MEVVARRHLVQSLVLLCLLGSAGRMLGMIVETMTGVIVVVGLEER